MPKRKKITNLIQQVSKLLNSMDDTFFFFQEKTFNVYVLLVLKENGLFLRYNLQIPNSMNMDELSLQIHNHAPETSANRCSAFERNYNRGIHERFEYVLILSYENYLQQNYVKYIAYVKLLIYLTPRFLRYQGNPSGTASVVCSTNRVRKCLHRRFKVYNWGALRGVRLKQRVGMPYSLRSSKMRFQRRKSQLMKDSELIRRVSTKATVSWIDRYMYMYMFLTRRIYTVFAFELRLWAEAGLRIKDWRLTFVGQWM